MKLYSSQQASRSEEGGLLRATQDSSNNVCLHALVVDTDDVHRRRMLEVLRNQGWRACETGSAEEALRMVDRYNPALVFCDMQLEAAGDGDSQRFTLLSSLRKRLPSAEIIITAEVGRSNVIWEAIINGASDYMRKLCVVEKIRERSRRLIERLRASAREANDAAFSTDLAATEAVSPLWEMIGESEAMINLYTELALIVNNIRHDHLGTSQSGRAGARLPSLLITGETGTGKELLAQIIHQCTGRAEELFIPVNCSALPTELAESELFGHAHGAFTGGVKEKVGLWEAASGGTLFLDEISEAPTSIQAKLLRVLQDGRIRRVGSNRFVQTDVQVIAASNRDMEAEIRDVSFRRDLFYRLSFQRLHLPPLRDRIEDIPRLVEYFIRRHFVRNIRFSREALDELMRYSFPGNVRELENIVWGAGRRSRDGVVCVADLRKYMETMGVAVASNQEHGDAPAAEALAGHPLGVVDCGGGLAERVHRFKLEVVKETLVRCGGNVTQTAHALKISRPSLYRLLRGSDEECARPS